MSNKAAYDPLTEIAQLLYLHELMHQTIRTILFWVADDEEPDYDGIENLSYYDGKDLTIDCYDLLLSYLQGYHTAICSHSVTAGRVGYTPLPWSQENKISTRLVFSCITGGQFSV